MNDYEQTEVFDNKVVPVNPTCSSLKLRHLKPSSSSTYSFGLKQSQTANGRISVRWINGEDLSWSFVVVLNSEPTDSPYSLSYSFNILLKLIHGF